MKELDKIENEFLPQIMVNTTEIIFDHLKFNYSQCKQVSYIIHTFIKKCVIEFYKIHFTDCDGVTSNK